MARQTGKIGPEVLARYEKIWQAVRQIPPGKVTSYGNVARLAGMPRRARLVGQALKALPEGSDVPWHRVVNVQGRIAFAQGSQAWRRQRDKLMSEGVEVVAGRISLARHDWAPSLDELLWKPGGDWDQ